MNVFLERLLYFWLGVTGLGLLIVMIFWAIKIIVFVAFISFFVALATTLIYHFFWADRNS
tara:strand:- start:388 stop:567 length:180 start_codon:yes stop_codon:yes gene_type:complete